MSSFQKSEESCCLLQNSNQPSKAGGGWGARFSVTNNILWLQNFEAFIWQPWESKKKKKKSHNDRMFLFKRQLHQWKKQHSNYREPGTGTWLKCIYEHSCACTPKKPEVAYCFIWQICVMPATGNSMRKKGWGRGFEGCWAETGSVQTQEKQFKSL